MFELAAIPMPKPMPQAGGASSASAQNQGEAGEGATFDALLALAATPAASTMPTPGPIPPPAADLPVPGNMLPLPATPPCAVIAAITLAEPDTLAETTVAEDADSEARGDASPTQALPDPGILATLLAAPDRILASPAGQPPRASASQAATAQATLSQAAPAQAAAAQVIASAARIELEPARSLASPLHASPLPQTAVPGVAPTEAPLPSRQSAADTAPASLSADDGLADQSGTALPMLQPRAEASALPAAPAAPVSAATPERIDFAKLVDTLARAREEASPQSIRVSVAHAEFGKVSLRFEPDSTGMTVAMSSPDAGFVRAVSATAEAAATSTNADSPRQQSQQTQADARSSGQSGSPGGGHRESARQHEQQRDARWDRTETPRRDQPAKDDGGAASGGIFA